jgi:hypothetical protein
MLRRYCLLAAGLIGLSNVVHAGAPVPEPGSGTLLVVGGAVLGVFAGIRAWRSRSRR